MGLIAVGTPETTSASGAVVTSLTISELPAGIAEGDGIAVIIAYQTGSDVDDTIDLSNNWAGLPAGFSAFPVTGSGTATGGGWQGDGAAAAAGGTASGTNVSTGIYDADDFPLTLTQSDVPGLNTARQTCVSFTVGFDAGTYNGDSGYDGTTVDLLATPEDMVAVCFGNERNTTPNPDEWASPAHNIVNPYQWTTEWQTGNTAGEDLAVSAFSVRGAGVSIPIPLVKGAATPFGTKGVSTTFHFDTGAILISGWTPRIITV